MKHILPFFVILVAAFSSCKNKNKETPHKLLINTAQVKEMTDAAYPDNPDMDGRSKFWDKYEHHKVQIDSNNATDFTVTFFPSNKFSDTLKIEHVNLLDFMPTVPNYITSNYLKYIGIINSEWNRQQVKFVKNQFYTAKNKEEGKKTVRVDLARNCLNSTLWEIITYTNEDGKQKSMYHGWFKFPLALYEKLFNEKNKGKLVFNDYKDHLINWKTPETKVIDLSKLRTIDNEWQLKFKNYNNEMYPLTNARKGKYKDIVYPPKPTSINQLLNDSTTFATFAYPGFYAKAQPRPTTLSMLGIPKKVILRKTSSKNNDGKTYYEFDITFARNTDTTYLTKVVIGGIQIDSLPKLALNDYNNALKMPMGIGNHAFYETYNYCNSHPSDTNPYYGFILDSKNNWVDSHFFGVDGPLIYRDIDNPEIIHFWLLSFERQAMVTHLSFKIPEN